MLHYPTVSGPAESFLDSVSVILIEPKEPGNIGSAARAMMNMGLSRMVLVRPADTGDRQCRALAGKAYPLVENARVFEDWEEAVSEQHVLAGTTSARERSLRRPVLPVREAAGYLAERAGSRRIGLVFGPERTGLEEEQLARCQVLATIPAHPEHPVLNLAQAVLLFAYEISQAAGTVPAAAAAEPAASQRQREQMFGQAQALLTRVGFLSESNPEHIMSVLRGLARPDLSEREVRVLRGILSQTEWYLDEGHRLAPGEVRKP